MMIDSKSLGINLESGREADVFKWFLACLLFGKPIQQNIAKRAYEMLIKNAKITNVDKMAQADWDTLVKWLDEAHYVRYDYSTATKLIETGKTLKEKYGSVNGLIKKSENEKDLKEKLMDFRGIGDTTASIFLRDLEPAIHLKH